MIIIDIFLSIYVYILLINIYQDIPNIKKGNKKYDKKYNFNNNMYLCINISYIKI